MTALIREPRPGDVEALAALHISTWRETYGHALSEDFFDDAALQRRRELWTRLTAEHRPGRSVVVAEIDGSVVGFAAAGPPQPDEVDPPRDLQLYLIYVAAAHHGGGAGQAMIDAVLGDRPAYLWVMKDNPRAQAFYRRNRFRSDGMEKGDPTAPAFRDARMLR